MQIHDFRSFFNLKSFCQCNMNGMCMLTTSIPSLGGLFTNSMARKTGCHDMTITVDVACLTVKQYKYMNMKSKYPDERILINMLTEHTKYTSTLINFLAYRVFTHPFFIQLRIWNFNWVSSILLRTLFSINWVKWKTVW